RELLLEQAARGESLPMKGEARDMTALVASLKSHSPMKRPAAAEALAAIHRILDKPKRRIRMLTAVLAIVLLLAGAAKYAFDITAARKEAERRRNQAESLVRFLVGDLRQKLESVGRLDVLDDAASRALAYFESLRPEEMTGQDLNDNALALTQLGRAREQQGNLAEAIALFRQSKRFAEAAAARDGSREDWQLTLSNTCFFLGDTLRREGNTAEALRNFQTYFAISRSLAQKHPGDAKYQAEVSYAHGNLGAVHEASGDLLRALEEYRVSLEMDRRRHRGDPANESWQADVANSANRLGVVLQKIGDFTGARNAFAEDLQLRRSLFQAVPNDVRRKRRLAVSLAWAGQLHLATGDRDAAIASYREEAELTKELAESDPTNSSAKRNWSVARARLAELLPPADGLPLAEGAARDLRSLVEADSRTTWRRDLAGTLMRVGMLRAQTGDRDGARSATEEALALGEDLVAAQPSDASSIRILAETLLHLARLDEREGQTAAAQRRRERVLAVTAKTSGDPFVAAARARALAALGRGSEAAALANKLIAGGYREAELVTATAAPRTFPSTPP
ncbi:MAG TPA: tetratricopeptide repeat protein, partial [Thermoanaerobaculia bacterium]|nr:tetratricopeptide repeat protein [Thermoanaerobaculia bacterium]